MTQLLLPELRRATLMIWGTFFFTFMTLYFLTSWIPKIAADAGLPPAQAIYAGAAFNTGALIGIMLLGWLSAGMSLTGLIALFFVGGPATMLLFAWLHDPLWLLFAELVLMGVFIQGGFSGLYAVAARAYPTAVRTTGVGWGLGAGRFGAIFGPLLGGVVLSAGASMQTSFHIFAVPMIIAGVLVWDARRAESRRVSACILNFPAAVSPLLHELQDDRPVQSPSASATIHRLYGEADVCRHGRLYDYLAELAEQA